MGSGGRGSDGDGGYLGGCVEWKVGFSSGVCNVSALYGVVYIKHGGKVEGGGQTNCFSL